MLRPRALTFRSATLGCARYALVIARGIPYSAGRKDRTARLSIAGERGFSVFLADLRNPIFLKGSRSLLMVLRRLRNREKLRGSRTTCPFDTTTLFREILATDGDARRPENETNRADENTGLSSNEASRKDRKKRRRCRDLVRINGRNRRIPQTLVSCSPRWTSRVLFASRTFGNV